MINTLLSPLIKAFLHTEYCYCQYYSIDITLDILGYTLDILGLDILGLDILGLDILGLDILGYTRLSSPSNTLSTSDSVQILPALMNVLCSTNIVAMHGLRSCFIL